MSENGQSIVEMQGLTRRFGELVAVDRLDLDVAEGEIFGLLGPDGAGKTTTLRMLAGLIDPDDGTAMIGGEDVSKAADRVRDMIGYMAQRFGLYPDLTVDENMRFYSDLFGVPRAEHEKRTERLLKMTRMAQFRGRQAGRLSGGMKQKLALMCVLLHRPNLLLLDEPTNGVDPVSRRDFWAILYELVKEGVTVLVTTAYLDEAERCNRVGLMYGGRMVLCDTPDVIRKSPTESCCEIDCRQRARARELLRGVEGVSSVEAFGDKVHLFLDRAKTSPKDLATRLENEGIDLAEIKEIEPSLEDVFILQIRKQEARDAGPDEAGNDHE